MEGPDTERLFQKAGGGEERGKEVRKSHWQLQKSKKKPRKLGFGEQYVRTHGKRKR